jgi:hypothetical protein
MGTATNFTFERATLAVDVSNGLTVETRRSWKAPLRPVTQPASLSPDQAPPT